MTYNVLSGTLSLYTITTRCTAVNSAEKSFITTTRSEISEGLRLGPQGPRVAFLDVPDSIFLKTSRNQMCLGICQHI